MLRPGPLVTGLEQAADPRLRAEDIEEIPGGPNALHALGRRLVAQVRAVSEEPGKPRERSVSNRDSR